MDPDSVPVREQFDDPQTVARCPGFLPPPGRSFGQKRLGLEGLLAGYWQSPEPGPINRVGVGPMAVKNGHGGPHGAPKPVIQVAD